MVQIFFIDNDTIQFALKLMFRLYLKPYLKFMTMLSFTKEITLVLVALLLTINSASAQLLKRVLKRTTDKVEQKVEDKIVEGISNELANRAVRPIDKLYEDMFREQYRAQYGKEYEEGEYEDSAERMAAMTNMINAMYGNVELPPSYTFQYVMEVEVFDFGAKKPNTMRLLINPDKEIFGMEQNEKGKQYIIFDFEKDLMTVYNEEEKSAVSIPGVMKMGITYAATDPNLNDKLSQVKIEKMNKSKNILGYNSQGYKSKSEEEESEFYVTNELKFGWKESFGKMLQKSAPNFYKDTPEMVIEGMMMEAKTKRKTDNQESKWITTKVDDSTMVIDNSKYQLQNKMIPTKE